MAAVVIHATEQGAVCRPAAAAGVVAGVVVVLVSQSSC